MNKNQISQFFGESPKEQWVKAPIEQMLLTAELLPHTPESEAQINQWLDDYLNVIVSKPLRKKIRSYKAIVIWPAEDGALFRPHVSDVSSFRYGVNKYTIVITVKHYEFTD